MQFFKQSTAASLIVGPILDSAGVEYDSAVIGDLSISKNGATLTALAAAATLTYVANGYYTLALTTGNLDTVGRADISCNKATYQMPPRELMVLQAAAYDQFVGGSFAKLGVAGIVTTGGTTTSVPTSSLSPAAAVTDQFKGRTVIFDDDTTTAALRGQATDITGSTSGGTLTVTALTTAPVNGDTFRIV